MDKQAFNYWYEDVDLCLCRLGKGVDDFSWMPWEEWFKEGVDAETAADWAWTDYERAQKAQSW